MTCTTDTATPVAVVNVTGVALRAARLRAGLSQGALARALGCTPTSVRNWEHGRTVPIAAFRRRLTELLDLTNPTSEGGAR